VGNVFFFKNASMYYLRYVANFFPTLFLSIYLSQTVQIDLAFGASKIRKNYTAASTCGETG